MMKADRCPVNVVEVVVPVMHQNSPSQPRQGGRALRQGTIIRLSSQWVKARIILSQKTPAASRSSHLLAIEPGPVGGLGLGEVLGTTKFQW